MPLDAQRYKSNVTITPDTKDWTWVLEKPCHQCGFDVRTFPRDQVGRLIRENVEGWGRALNHDLVRERPSPDVWSGLEYACHVRDVYRLYTERLEMMLEQEVPDYPNWDQDAAAIEQRYEEQDPAQVAPELAAAGTGLAALFDSVQGEAWERTGNRSDGAKFTVESFARYLIHDPVHHLWDADRGFERLTRERPPP